jgi:hypothetical protein
MDGMNREHDFARVWAELSKAEARAFLLRYQGLDGGSPFKGTTGVREYVRRVGCIQYDPLDVVGRNADLVLQSRVAGYRRPMLDKLLYGERHLLDGWDKMASIYLTEDWPRFSRLRQKRTEEVKWVLQRRSSEAALEVTEAILEILAEKGPMLSTGIRMGKAEPGAWGHRNLAGAAMDYLFVAGRIGVHGKRNTQRIYDLIERLLPQTLLSEPEPFADEDAFVRWYVTRRVGSVGLLWNRNGGGWLGQYLENKTTRTKAITELAEAGTLLRVQVEDETEPFWMREADAWQLEGGTASNASSVGGTGQPVRVLAPLDNLIWDREMARRLFGLDYSWEVYVPVHKRKYGYYVLPVLMGDRFVGRFEPEPQRGDAPLQIRRWWWEEDLCVGKGVGKRMKHAVKKGLHQFAAYLGTELHPEDPPGW